MEGLIAIYVYAAFAFLCGYCWGLLEKNKEGEK